MQIVKTILLNSGDALKTWTVLHDACHAKNIKLHSLYAQPAFVQGIVTQQIGCMFDALNEHNTPARRKKRKRPADGTELLLKPTPMGRIVTDIVKTEGCQFTDGLGWTNVPRSSRGKPHQSVTRKSKSSVEAISEEAQSMLVDIFASANDATTHAKRKTLMKADLELVNSILAKHGLTC